MDRKYGLYPPVAGPKEVRPGLLAPADYKLLAPATTTTPGTMSAADKAKLDGLARPLVRLNYNLATDALSSTVLTANTWTNIGAAQNFTITSFATDYEIFLAANVYASFASVGFFFALGLLIDGTTRIVFDSGVGNAGEFADVGGGAFLGTSLAAGGHTVQPQIIANQAVTTYCRAATAAPYEFLRLQIKELAP